ncbi:hypothetical protein [Streptomyces sp. SID3212]|uniref:hypothetical protein n=1 Tax=Streptomyces sp. SID3212 TaxID=2690259 RepID=UPI00136B9571|nr:hypothetical protein [Streptomyces sp. SID3212]MYV55481.1 hypothetical protein [Streptomyces sp. SID3212]
MKPLIYGYMRLFSDVTDQQVYATEQEMRRFAQAAGFQLAAVFHDVESGSHEAFYELGVALRRADAHDVVLPSLPHLSTNDVLQDALLDCLEDRFQAQVHVLATPATQDNLSPADKR